MITGTVDQFLNAFVRLEFTGENGIIVGHDMLFDTGFSEYFSLPQDLIDALGYPVKNKENVKFSDGITREVTIDDGRVLWDGQEQKVPIHCLNGDPLLGISQVENYLITFRARAGETVTFVPLP